MADDDKSIHSATTSADADHPVVIHRQEREASLMPSKSAAQHRYFEMIAHDPTKAKAAGVPQSVGQEFVAADKAENKKFPAARGMIKPAQAK